MRWAYLALCIVLAIPVQAQSNWWDNAAPPVVHGKQMPSSWWEAAKRGAARNNSTPFRVAAVMYIEMGGWKSTPAGKGKNGRKYIGPCGFNKHCNIPRDVMYTPEKQVEWATGLLTGTFTKRLKKYNTNPHNRDKYVKAVVGLATHLEAQAHDDLSKRCFLQQTLSVSED